MAVTLTVTSAKDAAATSRAAAAVGTIVKIMLPQQQNVPSSNKSLQKAMLEELGDDTSDHENKNVAAGTNVGFGRQPYRHRRKGHRSDIVGGGSGGNDRDDYDSDRISRHNRSCSIHFACMYRQDTRR